MVIRPFESGFASALYAFLATQYPGTPKSDPRYFEWKFARNPLGSSLGGYLVAMDGDAPVGQVATLVDRLRVDGNSHACAWLADLIVSLDHRSHGLVALRLLKELMDRHEVLLVNGVGPAIVPLYEGLKWRRIPGAALTTHYSVIRPGRLARVSARNLPPGLDLLNWPFASWQRLRSWWKSPATECLAELDTSEVQEFLERMEPSLGPTTFRSSRLYAWRFLRRPIGQSIALRLSHAGRMRGLAVGRLLARQGAAGWIEGADIVVDPADGEAFDALVEGLLAAALHYQCDFVRLSLSHPRLVPRLRPPVWIEGEGAGNDVFVYARDRVLQESLARYTWHMSGLIADRVDTGQDELGGAGGHHS